MPLVGAVEQKGQKMIVELKRYLRAPLYWLGLAISVLIRGVLTYLDMKHREGTYWEIAADYWNPVGCVSFALIILAVLIHQFSEDKETGAITVINSTRDGRIKLYFRRLAAGMIMTVLTVAILSLCNVATAYCLAPDVPVPDGFAWVFTCRTLIALLGGMGFFLAASFVCDAISNQMAAMCICGMPFACSFFINFYIVKDFQFPYYYILHGFFTEFMRGRLIYSQPVFWCVWYAVLIIGLFVLSIYKRKERKQL